MQIGICLKMKNKQNFFKLFWEKYPYLHSTLKIENMKFTYETNMNENVYNMLNMISKKKYKMKYLIMNN